ncbi:MULTISPECIES: hypothetical protein [Streptomyces]|uniref:hypothetical protein n=1 Tax=Streptomyces TaxID=1883 RepID=UPI002FDC1BE3
MARFEVYISDEGLAEIEGEPLVPAPGQSVHDVVLDRLHRYAVEHGRSVEATVTERPDEGHFVLEVAPDGSSRLLTLLEEPFLDDGSEPVSESQHQLMPAYGPEPEAGPEPAAERELGPELDLGSEPVFESRRSSEPSQEPRGEPGSSPEPTAGPAPVGLTVVAAAVARAAAAARVTTPIPALTAPSKPAIAFPAELARRISHMNALASTGRLDEAYELASGSRQELTDEVGADDPYAVEARALESYFAHLCGDHREAVVLALAVARIRCGAGDRRAPEDVARAVAAWQWLDDERAIVVHGHELLHMWEQLSHRGLLSPAHAGLAGKVRRRMEEVEAFV